MGQYQGKVEDLLDNSEYNIGYICLVSMLIYLDASFVLTDEKGNPIAPKMKIALSFVSPSTATGLNLAPQNNDYLAIGGLPAAVDDPQTRVQQAKEVGSVAYEGFKTVIEGLYDCSDIFLPLKTATGGILTFIKLFEVCVFVYNNNNLLIVYSCGSDRVGE